MASNDDNYFFQAFLHSLRSSCFQFIDFREHVSIRGYLAVEVDGKSQQHFVLAEHVNRGKENSTDSFPLEVSKSDNTMDSFQKSEKSAFIDDSRRNNKCRKTNSELPFTNIRPVKKSGGETLFQSMRSPKKSTITPMGGDNSQPRSYKFSRKRSDLSNTTFTMETANNADTNEYIGITRLGANSSANTCASTTTVNITPSKSILIQNGNIYPSESFSSNNGDIKTSTQNSLSEKTKRHRLMSSSTRKRSRKSLKLSRRESTFSSEPFLQTSESSSDNNAYPGFLKHKRHAKDYKNETRGGAKNKRSPYYNTRTNGLSKRNKTMATTHSGFSQFLLSSDSDPECSISAVKPYYLLSHADDMNIIMSGMVAKDKICTLSTTTI